MEGGLLVEELEALLVEEGVLLVEQGGGTTDGWT